MPVNGPVSGKLPTPNATSALSLIPRPAGSAPALSVAMSCYNSEPYTALAIESILAQTFGDFEFLIVDDGSKDGTAETIMRYADRDKRIRPILRENRGLVASLNQMLSLARAPWILSLIHISFVEELKKHNLLMEGEVAIQQEGVEQPFVYRGFQMVDQEKLREIRGDVLRGWNQSGLLPLIFAHLFSLDLIREIFGRQVQAGLGPVTAVTEHAESVSYTHLDVYKRQGFACRCRRSGGVGTSGAGLWRGAGAARWQFGHERWRHARCRW